MESASSLRVRRMLSNYFRESASSSSSFSKVSTTYDVFISFRGKDTRTKFVSHLHYALSKAGLNTFLDDDSLQRGKELNFELRRAIERSKIQLVVFSKSYTESSWCLDELEHIMRCEKLNQKETTVVPIFYDVDPSVVRHQSDDFGKALKETAERRYPGVDAEVKLSWWRSALTRAANLSGWNSMNHRSESELVEKIVEDILKKLGYGDLFTTKFPVGLVSRVRKVIRLIDNQSNKVSIIGIWGMGGVGKTTTAKAIYNQLRHKFMERSFIEDIRQVCQTDKRGHTLLQKKLLSDILKKEIKVLSVGMGKTMIKERLSGKSMLIVLDDVNEFGQLEDLCGNREWFGPRTVIIITTRDVHLLKQLEVDYVYKMEEMDENESLELFSWHAFGQSKPIEDFKELTRNVVAYCGGLPLALRVLGSYLIGRQKQLWDSVLSKLEKIPNDQVQKILRISFDGLSDPMEKDIFLDICCFFIGKDRGYVTDILNGCGLCADIGITVLIERSLITVEKKNKLGMHHLLRDMGREIICESSRNEPWKRSRLWFQEDVLDVLTNSTGTMAIQGITLKLNFTSRDCFEAHTFKEMKRLRLLQLDHVQLTGNYEYLSKQLKWICWQGFHLKTIPNNFDMKGVIAIDLKHSNLILVWKKTQVLPWLKILNLSHSKSLIETPDFLGLPSLEKLILKDCPSLQKVHQSVGSLHNLLLINLKDCTSVNNLPRETYKLKSVKTLILSGCTNIDKLEEDIVQMESLTTLVADNTAVKQVPFSIVNSKSIGYISLCGFEGLSRNVFPSIIWSWMSPTISPLSYIRPFGGVSSSIVSMDVKNNNLGDLELMLSNLSNLRSVLVQCDTYFELSKQLRTILDDVYGANFSDIEITSYRSQSSNDSLRSYLIGLGSYQEVFNTLSRIISEGLAAGESCDVFQPTDNNPFWLAFMGEGHSVYFTVPEDCRMKGMILCVVYSSTPENTATEFLISVLMVNYTKCTIQIYKQDTVISFGNSDWEGIISHFGSGDKVEIFLTFGHGLVVKKTCVYLIYDKSIDIEIDPSLEPINELQKERTNETEKESLLQYDKSIDVGIEPSPEPINEPEQETIKELEKEPPKEPKKRLEKELKQKRKKKAFVRFIKKIIMC